MVSVLGCDGVIVLLMLCVNVLMMLEGSCKVVVR